MLIVFLNLYIMFQSLLSLAAVHHAVEDYTFKNSARVERAPGTGTLALFGIYLVFIQLIIIILLVLRLLFEL